MTPSDALRRLREIANARRRLDAEEVLLLDLIEGRRAPSAPATFGPDREISTAVASKIMKCGYSSAYRRARKFGLARQTESGEWKFSERACRAFAGGQRCGENGEIGDAPPLPMAMQSADDLTSKE